MSYQAKRIDPKLVLFFIFLIVLQVFSGMFQFFPTFVGVFFCYVLFNLSKEEKFPYIVLSLLYLSFYDLNKGFFLFSYMILLLVFYYLFAERILAYFKCKNCVIFIYVFVAYIGHFFLNELIAYILHEPYPSFSLEYMYYIGFDYIIASVLFRSSS